VPIASATYAPPSLADRQALRYCVVRFRSADARTAFRLRYDHVRWPLQEPTAASQRDHAAQSPHAPTSRCAVRVLRAEAMGDSEEPVLRALPELNPPAGLPHGNVGTSWRCCLEAVERCELPAVVLGALGISRRVPPRRYSAVPPPPSLLAGAPHRPATPVKHTHTTGSNTTIDRKNHNQNSKENNSRAVSRTVSSVRAATTLRGAAGNGDEERAHTLLVDASRLRHRIRYWPSPRPTTALLHAHHHTPHATSSVHSTSTVTANITSVASAAAHRAHTRAASKVGEDDDVEAKEEAGDGDGDDEAGSGESDSGAVERWDRQGVLEPVRYEERRYEQPLEVVWEKGGSGLVFYTDECFWAQREADERDADELESFTDLERVPPTRCRSRAQREQARLQCTASAVRAAQATLDWPLGAFERYTRGIGGRLLRAHGWTGGALQARGEETPVGVRFRPPRLGLGGVVVTAKGAKHSRLGDTLQVGSRKRACLGEAEGGVRIGTVYDHGRGEAAHTGGGAGSSPAAGYAEFEDPRAAATPTFVRDESGVCGGQL
jgi:hypothetical protein